MSSTPPLDATTLLPEYVGYLVVLAFGALFALATTWITHLDQRFVDTQTLTSESFNTAGRY